jgi:hypothetical protein
MYRGGITVLVALEDVFVSRRPERMPDSCSSLGMNFMAVHCSNRAALVTRLVCIRKVFGSNPGLVLGFL